MKKTKRNLFFNLLFGAISLFLWWLPAVRWAPEIMQYFGINGQENHGFMSYFQALVLLPARSLGGTDLGTQILENLGINFDYGPPPFIGSDYICSMLFGLLLLYPFMLTFAAGEYAWKASKYRSHRNLK